MTNKVHKQVYVHTYVEQLPSGLWSTTVSVTSLTNAETFYEDSLNVEPVWEVISPEQTFLSTMEPMTGNEAG